MPKDGDVNIWQKGKKREIENGGRELGIVNRLFLRLASSAAPNATIGIDARVNVCQIGGGKEELYKHEGGKKAGGK